MALADANALNADLLVRLNRTPGFAALDAFRTTPSAFAVLDDDPTDGTERGMCTRRATEKQKPTITAFAGTFAIALFNAS